MKNPVMYIIANKGLGMSPGKLAAQVAHAAVRAVWNTDAAGADEYEAVNEWLAKGETKIVLEARHTEHLLMAERYINEKGIKTFLVIDEGRTEIPPHTPTALASQIVDKDLDDVRLAFGDFKTYRIEPDMARLNENRETAARLLALTDALLVLSPRNQSKVLEKFDRLLAM